MESIELTYLVCPKCSRILKPTGMNPMKLEDGEEVIYLDIGLGCRYCKITVNTSVLKKQKDPKEFLRQFTRVPENVEIDEESLEKIRLREAHKENFMKYKHYPIPRECVDCGSKDIVADSCDNAWICLSCDSWFAWRSFRVIYHGNIEVQAENEDSAIDIAYEFRKKGYVDFDVLVDWM